jgi:PEGA domain
VNLLFFTVELERNRDRPVSSRSRSASGPRWSRLRWIGLAIAAIICAAAFGCGGWVLAGGNTPIDVVPEWLGLNTDWSPADTSGRAWLEVTSRPDKATVYVDGHQKGKTPLSLAVSEATHTLVLKHPDAVDDQHTVHVSTDTHVNASMWRRRPDAVQLKPPYPGATISDAGFLADGRLALSIALPVLTGGLGGNVLREAWIFDPASGSLEPFETSREAPHAPVVAVSPDGRRVAYLQAAQPEMQGGGGTAWLSEVWVAGGGSGGPPVQVIALPSKHSPTASGSAPSEVEEVHDVAWTPDSRYLLVIAQLVSVSGGYPAAPRSRLLVVEAPLGNHGSSKTVAWSCRAPSCSGLSVSWSRSRAASSFN